MKELTNEQIYFALLVEAYLEEALPGEKSAEKAAAHKARSDTLRADIKRITTKLKRTKHPETQKMLKKQLAKARIALKASNIRAAARGSTASLARGLSKKKQDAAARLRYLKGKAGEKATSAKTVIANNPKTAAGIAAGGIVVGGAGAYGIYRAKMAKYSKLCAGKSGEEKKRCIDLAKKRAKAEAKG